MDLSSCFSSCNSNASSLNTQKQSKKIKWEEKWKLRLVYASFWKTRKTLKNLSCSFASSFVFSAIYDLRFVCSLRLFFFFWLKFLFPIIFELFECQTIAMSWTFRYSISPGKKVLKHIDISKSWKFSWHDMWNIKTSKLIQ